MVAEVPAEAGQVQSLPCLAWFTLQRVFFQFLLNMIEPRLLRNNLTSLLLTSYDLLILEISSIVFYIVSDCVTTT